MDRLLSNEEINHKVTEQFGKFYNPSQLGITLDSSGKRIVGQSPNDAYMLARITGKEAFPATPEALKHLTIAVGKWDYQLVLDRSIEHLAR